MKKITAILAGAGDRGANVFGKIALKHPKEVQFVAVAEPDRGRRESFAAAHGIAEENQFACYTEMLDRPKLADALVVCTQDRMHFDPAKRGLEKGYHILLEKPMSVDAAECVALGQLSDAHNKVFMICHVLRYTPFFARLKALISSGAIGKVVSIQHNENVGYWHMAHSFVRGNWGNSAESSPMILAKSSHDMDMISWLADEACVHVSSFGSLMHFRPENAPEGSTARCTDGCAVEPQCAFSAVRQYLGPSTGWPTSAISLDTSLEARTTALQEGPYGRCVYRCDNNVVDHQVVNMEFANGTTASFTMCGLTHDNSRTLKIMGTEGEIRAAMNLREIEVRTYASGERAIIVTSVPEGGHGGGDDALFRDFVHQVRNEGRTEGLTSARRSVQSHLMAFAAEQSRLEKRVVNLGEFLKN